jgi:predicted acyl esterase
MAQSTFRVAPRVVTDLSTLEPVLRDVLRREVVVSEAPDERRSVSLLSWAVARALRLDKPLSGKVRVERDLRVPMTDGVELLADRYAPDGGNDLPVVLIRTPYGRRATPFKLFGELFAERGYQAVVQSCRGTFGSGGEWRPFQTDREDGLATIEWLRRQPWFGGKVGMFGPSSPAYKRCERLRGQPGHL